MGYTKGELLRCVGTWQDKTNSDAYIDPGVVKFKYIKPGLAAVTLTYLTDVEVVRDSQGMYHVDLDLDVSGKWYYKFFSTGVGQSAKIGTFLVDVAPI
jgi:hypothetical protein